MVLISLDIKLIVTQKLKKIHISFILKKKEKLCCVINK